MFPISKIKFKLLLMTAEPFHNDSISAFFSLRTFCQFYRCS